ncbi:DNZ54_00345 family protein, partial [Escherichia coli]|nr:DNZ54_00345 family protein [Escherichia coli]
TAVNDFMDCVHHIWCPLFSQEFQDLPDGAETTLTWVMRLLIVVSLAWTGWAITLVFYLLTVIAFWITRNQMAQQVSA